MRAVLFTLVVCLAGTGGQALGTAGERQGIPAAREARSAAVMDREARSAAVIDADLAAAPLPPSVLDEVDDIAFVPLLAQGFAGLPLHDKLLAYELVQASQAGQPIIYDQRGQHLGLIRQVLEALVTHLPASMPEKERRLYSAYLKRFYAHRGYHDSRTLRKFLPGFTPEQLARACMKARLLGARFPGVLTAAGLAALLDGLQRPLFDPQYEPEAVVQTPQPGQDPLRDSAATYYSGLGLRDVERGLAQGERYPLNSTVVKQGKALQELVWRVGTDALTAGRYGAELKAVVAHLEAALVHAPREQGPELRDLVAYLRGGEAAALRRYTQRWLEDQQPVGALLGFFDTGRDARGKKGQYQGLVYLQDEPMTARLRRLAHSAQAYQELLPAGVARRRSPVQAPEPAAVTVLSADGSAGPFLERTVRLPQELPGGLHGQRTLLLSNVGAAVDRALLRRVAGEFSCPAEVQGALRYGRAAAQMFAAMRQVLGQRPPAERGRALRDYQGAVGEARADAVALYSALDPLTLKLGLLQGPAAQGELARGYLREALFGLRLVPQGDTLEGDRDRGRQLVIQYLIRKAKVVRVAGSRGHRAYCAADLDALRRACGDLVHKLSQVEDAGDYAAARDLVETYGRLIDRGLRDEVLVRAAKLPGYVALVAPNLLPVRDGTGQITDVRLEYPRDYLRQHLAKPGAPR